MSYEATHEKRCNLALKGDGNLVYEGATEELKTHLGDLREQLKMKNGEQLLKDFESQWKGYRRSLDVVNDVLMHLDQTYVQASQKKAVIELGMHLFNEIVIKDQVIAEKLVEKIRSRVVREEERKSAYD